MPIHFFLFMFLLMAVPAWAGRLEEKFAELGIELPWITQQMVVLSVYYKQSPLLLLLVIFLFMLADGAVYHQLARTSLILVRIYGVVVVGILLSIIAIGVLGVANTLYNPFVCTLSAPV